jgi:hypothetical protein
MNCRDFNRDAQAMFTRLPRVLAEWPIGHFLLDKEIAIRYM